MPLATKFHHSQLPAMPLRATIPVTASGVSAAKVVATIDVPASHHGTFRPERKYSERLEPARRRYAMPTTTLTRKYAATMVQSSQVSVMVHQEGTREAGRGMRDRGKRSLVVASPTLPSPSPVPRPASRVPRQSVSQSVSRHRLRDGPSDDRAVPVRARRRALQHLHQRV